MAIPDLAYTIPQVAKGFHTDAQNIYILCELGYIKTLKLGSKKITPKEIDRFVEEHGNEDLNKIIKEAKEKKKKQENIANIIQMDTAN